MRFGTDGVRGVANAELTPEFALSLGRAAARVLGGDHFLIGRDTRRSGPMLEAALAAGLCAEGRTVELLGVLPTPAVACLSALDGVGAAVISASHNPYADNGIKLFAPGGLKLRDDTQAAIEAELDAVPARRRRHRGHRVGRGLDLPRRGPGHGALRGGGARRARRTAARRPAVVLDCANGAASRRGARGVPTHRRRRDGHPRRARRAQHQRRLRFEPPRRRRRGRASSAAPTSASRSTATPIASLAVDRDGRLVDGDQLIAIAALDLPSPRASCGVTSWS